VFTGIIAHIGTVRSLTPSAGGKRLTVDLGPLAAGLAQGDSVAVNGACLTAAAPPRGSEAAFDVVAETLSRTNLGGLRAGSRVNLERALRLGDGLDGHLVQGHVDGQAVVAGIQRGGQWLIDFEAPELTPVMVAKGSVAIDGISLTLVEVTKSTFRVAVIPTTLAATTLGDRKTGDAVNIETDIIGKYVRKYILGDAGAEKTCSGLTLEKLRQAGFA
jgi:riboflavin synthase